jgi:hypothetical protein
MKLKRKMGRPIKSQGEARTRTRTFRLTESLDAQLRDAAKRAGWTVSDEIEHRLAQSFAPGNSRIQQLTEALAQEIASTAGAAVTLSTTMVNQKKGETK